MTSFQIGISPSRMAATRFVARVRRALKRAVVEEAEHQGINQSRVAEAIGVHRSVISRELNGRQDITLGRVAELAWALGREIEFDLVVPEMPTASNLPQEIAGANARNTGISSEFTFSPDENVTVSKPGQISRTENTIRVANSSILEPA